MKYVFDSVLFGLLFAIWLPFGQAFFAALLYLVVFNLIYLHKKAEKPESKERTPVAFKDGHVIYKD